MMQFDLGDELKFESMEILLHHLAMLGDQLCFQLLVSGEDADAYLVTFPEVLHNLLSIVCACLKWSPRVCGARSGRAVTSTEYCACTFRRLYKSGCKKGLRF